MSTIPKYLTSLSAADRSPGRRLVALLLCAMLALSAISPGLAFAGEADSEGEGAGVPVEAPDPNFDPGGEESPLGEVPAVGGSEEEGGSVEVEPEVEAELPVPAEVPEVPTTAAAPTELPAEPEPEPTAAAAAPNYAPEQGASQPGSEVEVVANQSLKAPPQHQDRVAGEVTEEAAPTSPETVPAAPPAEEAPRPTPPPAATTTTAPNRDLAGKRVYIVQPGDCLSYIAAALLPAGADTAQIEAEVERLWKLNADRIGTGDPNLIYAGTELLLH